MEKNRGTSVIHSTMKIIKKNSDSIGLGCSPHNWSAFDSQVI